MEYSPRSYMWILNHFAVRMKKESFHTVQFTYPFILYNVSNCKLIITFTFPDISLISDISKLELIFEPLFFHDLVMHFALKVS